jgi:WD40 repeat protein
MTSTYDALLRAYNAHVLNRTIKRQQIQVTERSISTTCEAVVHVGHSVITLCVLPENNVFVGTEEHMFSIINVKDIGTNTPLEDCAVFQKKDTQQRCYWHADLLDQNRIVLTSDDHCTVFNLRTKTMESRIPTSSTILDYGRKNLITFGGRYVIFGANNVCIRDVLQPHSDSNIELHEHTSDIRCLEMLPNLKLASGGDDKKIIIWDLPTKKVERTLEHDEWVWTMVYHTNETLVSGSSAMIYIWNYVTGTLLHTHSELGSWLRRMMYFSDQLICVTGDTGVMLVYDIINRTIPINFKNGDSPHTADVLGAEMLDDGRMITCSRDGSLRFWKVGQAITPGRIFQKLFATKAFKDCIILTKN